MKGGAVTDAGPTPKTLATLVGANTNHPNNFTAAPASPAPSSPADNTPGANQTSSTSTISISNVVSNAPSAVVQVENASHFQIGNNFAFDFSKGPRKTKKKKNKLAAVANSNYCDLPAVLRRTDIILTTSKLHGLRIGEPWRFVMRHLGLRDPEIENKHEEYINKGGIEEVIYQLLRLWTERNGSAATMDKLSRALFEENQMETLEALLQIFQEG